MNFAKPVLMLGYHNKAVPWKHYFLVAGNGSGRDWREVTYVYGNTICARDGCSTPKKVASETLWCDECNTLEMCDCGDAKADCNCEDYEPCKGCEDGCCECCPSMYRGYRSSLDRERFGYDG